MQNSEQFRNILKKQVLYPSVARLSTKVRWKTEQGLSFVLSRKHKYWLRIKPTPCSCTPVSTIKRFLNSQGNKNQFQPYKSVYKSLCFIPNIFHQGAWNTLFFPWKRKSPVHPLHHYKYLNDFSNFAREKISMSA